MAADPRDKIAVILPGVRPLEIWDAPVAGQTLFAAQGRPDFPAHLARVASRTCASDPARPSQVYISGGAARREGLSEALTSAGLNVLLAAEPVHAAALAGSEVLPGCLCVDVGQTAIKVARRGHCTSIPRALSRAPLRDQVAPSEQIEARASTVEFFAEVFASLMRRCPPPPCADILLALPCAIAPDGTLGECTYCWDSPDRHLPAELLSAFAGARVHLVHDAALAAVAAVSDPRLVPAPTLVLTLGYGVGAAYLDPLALAESMP